MPSLRAYTETFFFFFFWQAQAVVFFGGDQIYDVNAPSSVKLAQTPSLLLEILSQKFPNANVAMLVRFTLVFLNHAFFMIALFHDSRLFELSDSHKPRLSTMACMVIALLLQQMWFVSQYLAFKSGGWLRML